MFFYIDRSKRIDSHGLSYDAQTRSWTAKTSTNLKTIWRPILRLWAATQPCRVRSGAKVCTRRSDGRGTGTTNINCSSISLVVAAHTRRPARSALHILGRSWLDHNSRRWSLLHHHNWLLDHFLLVDTENAKASNLERHFVVAWHGAAIITATHLVGSFAARCWYFE